MPNRAKKKLTTIWKTLITATHLLFKPYLFRLRTKEGGLLAFAIVYSWFTRPSSLFFIINVAVSSLTYISLYAYNDFSDRFSDLKNPKKNKAFTKLLIEHQLTFKFTYCMTLLFISFLCLVYFDWKIFLIFVTVISTNTLYSKILKGVPIADIITIITCSGLFVLISTFPNYQLAITAGIMTGMPHLFQMLIDKRADKKANVRTTVVRYPGTIRFVTLILCLILASSYYFFSFPLLALASFLPIVFTYFNIPINTKWTITRIHFTVLWALQLYYTLN